MEASQVAAVVVTYNRRDMLGVCLDALLGQSVGDFGIVVVDNGSTDDTSSLVAQYKDPRVRYYNTGANLGGAGGFNWGMKQAIADGYEYLWLMDDDVAPEPTALAELIAADQELHGDYGFLSSGVYWTDGTPAKMNIQHTTLTRKLDVAPMQLGDGEKSVSAPGLGDGDDSSSASGLVPSVPSRPPRLGGRGRGESASVPGVEGRGEVAPELGNGGGMSRVEPTPASTHPIPIVLATFVSFFVPARVVRRFGYPIADFFIWADDWEYSRRISREIPGYAVLSSQVIHHLATNSPGTIATDAPERFWRYRYSYRNEVYLYRREGIRGVVLYLARLALHTLRILRDAKDRRWQRLKLMYSSAWAGIRFNPKIEYPS
ncbi:MAG: glycosyltransferase [Propionibacteriaceae bacterium]|jgi:GT2 family glycosyltransferase|nr:glycosyltransferase [Propionibacteriaceae bacterium]